MKELSIEEKAKAYDEALEKAKQIILEYDYDEHDNVFMEIFPELKESAGERIRKFLIKWIQDNYYHGTTEIPTKTLIAWLEKQGEQKPTLRERYKNIAESEWFKKTHDGMSISNDEEPKWTDDDKVEPKFKVGDWITDGQLTCKVLGITSKSYELHLHNDDYCHFETDIQSVDKHYHLWNIKDAKEGDVLTSIEFHRNCTFIFKGLDNWKFDEPNGDRAVATGYCCLSASADKMEFGIQGPDCVEVNNVKPATKIQRNLLFQKMREAGYEWDAEKKELKKIVDKEQIKKNLQDNSFRRMFEQKSIKWSEEDERMLDYALDMIEWYGGKNEKRVRLVSDWLKSLKQRYTWKPSDEQMVVLELASKYERVFTPKQIDILIDLKEQLKKLKGE